MKIYDKYWSRYVPPDITALARQLAMGMEFGFDSKANVLEILEML